MTNETAKKMSEYIADRDKLVKFLYGSGVMEDGEMLWYDGTIEALFSFIDRWIFKEISKRESRLRETCFHWHDGYCWGTREMDFCSCGGDKGKCDFYPKRPV